MSVIGDGFTTKITPTNIIILNHIFIGPKKYPILAEERHVKPINELNNPKNIPDGEVSTNRRDG